MGEVVTIRGPVASESLGVTLMHEHLLINWTREFRSDGLINDERLVTEELAAFAAAGGSTVVEVSTSQLTVGVTRRPTSVRTSGTRTDDSVVALARIAEAAGVNLVLGTGHYRHPYFDHALINNSTTDELAEQMVHEIEHGFGDTGIRAGLIGEIGCDRWYVSAEEERSFRASARAARRTGVCLSTHAVDYPVGLLQLDLLAEERLDTARIIIGHCDTVDIPEYHDEIIRRGAWVQFDTIRGLSDRDTTLRVEMITRLVRAGHASRLLLSHDVCKKSHLRANGGNGYTFLITSFLDRLRSAGISEEEIAMLTVHNPARALSR
jgi:predicted metal-dependent phosphotriesterase family hydrolase